MMKDCKIYEYTNYTIYNINMTKICWKMNIHTAFTEMIMYIIIYNYEI
jgi:hypothetical protein